MAVLMTQELADKMIADYQNAIDHVKSCKYIDVIKWNLDNEHIESGMCDLAFNKYKEHIYDCEWINGMMSQTNMYVFTPPYKCYTIPEIIESLEYRLNLLKQFPN